MNSNIVFTRASAAVRSGDFQSAINDLTDVLQSEEGNPEALHLMGLALLGQHKASEAIDVLKRAVDRLPGNAVYLGDLALAYVAEKRFDDAGEVYKTAIATDPKNLKIRSKFGSLLLDAKDYQGAEIQFAAIVAMQPQNAAAHYILGVTLAGQNRMPDAILSYRRAVDLKPDYLNALVQLAQSLGDVGDYESALSFQRRAVTLQPESASAHYSMAKYMRFVGKVDEAIETQRRVYALNPQFDGDKLRVLGLPGDMAFFSALLALRPYDPILRENLAYCLAMSGDTEAADREFESVAMHSGVTSPELKNIHRIYNRSLIAIRTAPIFRRRKRYVSLLERFAEVKHLDGQVVECGCGKGLSSFGLCMSWRESDPSFNGAGYHIFDSFQGLSEPLAVDVDGAELGLMPNIKAGRFAFTLETVKANLSMFPNVAYHPGWIPEKFHEVADLNFKFVNIDVDLYQPTRDVLMFFFPRMVSGGVMVCDDYNWPGARAAFAEASAEMDFKFDVTENNQVIVRKP